MKQTPILHLFLLLSIGYILSQYIIKEVVITDEHYFNSFGEQLSYQRIGDLLSFKRKWNWLGYIATPLFVFMKTSFITICLFAGAFSFNIQISLRKLYRVAVVGEFVFLIAMLIKVFWLLTFSDNLTLEGIQYFYPLSLINLLDVSSLDIWWTYPMQVINLFELTYWLLLAYGLHQVMNTSFKQSMGIVAASYGSGLVLWVAFITFLTVSIGV